MSGSKNTLLVSTVLYSSGFLAMPSPSQPLTLLPSPPDTPMKVECIGLQLFQQQPKAAREEMERNSETLWSMREKNVLG